MIDPSSVQAVILAGGKGTRMHAEEKNKVMFEIGGKPMISYPVESLKTLGITKPIVVVSFARESIMEYLKDAVEYAVQKDPKGTADAVRSAAPSLKEGTKHVIVLYGDHATFYTPDILQGLLDAHERKRAAMTLITTHTDPTGYGRILRDSSGKMVGIVEEKNATEEQKKITEINTGNGVYEKSFLLTYLPRITPNPVSKEYYFTDIVELGVKNRENIETYVVDDAAVSLGVNTPEQLNAAEEELQRRSAHSHG